MTLVDTKTTNLTAVLVVLSTIFFMWGLVTVVNFMLADDFRNVFQLSYMEALSLNMIFFGAYLVVSLPAGTLIDRIGYRKGMMTGTGIAALGCFLAYAAAGERSFGLFILALFVMASGITILQVAANPYVVLLGPRGRGASKLTLVQAFNSLGAFLAPLFAAGLFLSMANLTEDSYLTMSPEEIKASVVRYVQLPYLLLGGIWILLGLFLAFSKLPRINTRGLEPLIKESVPPRTSVWQFPHLVLGAIAIFAYVGAEVAIGSHLAARSPELPKYYWGLAMIGRFLGAVLLIKMSPRKGIGAFSLIASVLVLIFMFMKGESALYALVAIGFFNSILFPCIFTMGIDGLGQYSEEGSSVMVMAIVGGAIIPFLVALLDSNLAFSIVVLCYLYISFFGFRGSRYEKRTNFY